MNPTDRAFLDDIIANPEDDTPRLIYADWIEEQGQGERAELIRVQCELERLRSRLDSLGRSIGHTNADKIRPLMEREKKLLTPWNFWEWFADFVQTHWCGSPAVSIEGNHCEVGYFDGKDRPHWWLTICRGFVEALKMSAVDFMEHADAVLACNPVREVMLTTRPDYDTTTLYERASKVRLKGRETWWESGSVYRDKLDDFLVALLKAEFGQQITFTLPPQTRRTAHFTFIDDYGNPLPSEEINLLGDDWH